MKHLGSFISIVIAIGPGWPTLAQDPASHSEFSERLRSLPGVVEVTEARNNAELFRKSYEVRFSQALDHADPGAGTFEQRVFVSHTGYDKPVLLSTAGYAARRNSGGELQRLLGGNLVTVEHRFFGESVPSPCEWKYLTVKQAADDLHTIVTALKTLYPGEWVSSGRSKGGQTALFYKCYHPNDIDVVVACVAPVNLAQEDPRVTQFIETAGAPATRRRIKDFQVALFQREDEILPLIQAEVDKRRWTFAAGLSTAYEYGVLEYPYAFWQYGTNAEDVPAPDASAEALAAHYNRVGTLRFYSDQGKKQFEPFLYQAFTEIGYYNYDVTGFKACMKTVKNPSNLSICPKNVTIVYNPATMAFVHHFLQYKAHQVVYIYGENDAWSATQIQLLGRTDALKIVVQDVHHGASIRSFSPDQEKLFYTHMERWLGMKLRRP